MFSANIVAGDFFSNGMEALSAMPPLCMFPWVKETGPVAQPFLTFVVRGRASSESKNTGLSKWQDNDETSVVSIGGKFPKRELDSCGTSRISGAAQAAHGVGFCPIRAVASFLSAATRSLSDFIPDLSKVRDAA
jgi:hypothetical protein